MYSITDLGTFGGSNSAGYGINNSMQVVGWAGTTDETKSAPSSGKTARSWTWACSPAAATAARGNQQQGRDRGLVACDPGLLPRHLLRRRGDRTTSARSVAGKAPPTASATTRSSRLVRPSCTPMAGDTMPQALMVRATSTDISTFQDWFNSEVYDANDSTQLVGLVPVAPALCDVRVASSALERRQRRWDNDPTELIDLLTLGTYGGYGHCLRHQRIRSDRGGADIVTDPVRIRHAFLINPVGLTWSRMSIPITSTT